MTILTVPPSSTSDTNVESNPWHFIGEDYELVLGNKQTAEQSLVSGIGTVPWLTDDGIILESLTSGVANKLETVSSSCAERIKLLGELEPNWDGYGAQVISSWAMQRCVELMVEINETVGLYSEYLFIAPLADGGLELEWELPSGNELMLVVPPSSGPIEFLTSTVDRSSGEKHEHEGTIPADANLEDLLRLLSV